MGNTAKAYGYRDDPKVPPFRDDKPIIVFDGHCALCSGWVRFVIRHDPKGLFRFVPAQSPLGAALYRHYGLDDTDYETNILIEDGLPRFKLDGSIRMASLLGAPWSMAESLRALPQGLQRRLYDLVARNRLRLFGRLDTCHMPDPADRGRFLA
jgi:predicted DCC family thiol-disulfide oxidoreductase YuxK